MSEEAEAVGQHLLQRDVERLVLHFDHVSVQHELEDGSELLDCEGERREDNMAMRE